MKPALLAAAVLLAGYEVCAAACNEWHGRVCADETATNLPITQTYIAAAGGPVRLAAGRLDFDDQNGETVDLDISVRTSAGDGAAAGVVDLEDLINRQPELLSDAVVQACSVGGLMADGCADALGNANISEDTLQAATLWGHGCKRKSDAAHKMLPQIRLDPPTNSLIQGIGRYAVVAKAEADSTAVITVKLTRRAAQTTAAQVCGNLQSGRMPGIGQWAGTPVGTVVVDVQPQSGGTLSNIRFSGGSWVGFGSFILQSTTPGVTTELRYTGRVSECPFYRVVELRDRR